MKLAGCRATVMGLGHFGGGVAVTRWLARNGAEVTVTDRADSQTLARSLAELREVPVAKYTLGGHDKADFRGVDLLIVNPAVRPGDPFVEIARHSGARIATELGLFLDHCPAPSIGVTGTNGKSTTAAMIDAVLRADGRISWLGGNLGGSLLERLTVIHPSHWVVVEVSSFQLWRFAETARVPHVAVVTSFAPNHLDWHADQADYRTAKQKLLCLQKPDDLAVLNTHDAELATWSPLVRGKRIPLVPFDDIPPLRLPGPHNRSNAACAAASAHAIGCSPDAVRHGLSQFGGLPERLELIATLDGVEIYNDSSATTPESTVAAVGSLCRPIWLMAGGHNKGLDYAHLIAAVAAQCRGAAFYGAVRESFRTMALKRAFGFPCASLVGVHEAFHWCWRRAQPGEAIVFSPACSSHDQFLNYRQRGAVFQSLVESLAKRYNR